MRAGVGLDSIVSHWQIVLRGHRGSQVRCLELRFWRSSGKRRRTCPLLCLRIPISRIMESHGIRFHQYADDTQLYREIRSPVPSQMEALSQCVSALTFWFLDNGLQLNSTKSEAMILGSRQGLSRLEPIASLYIESRRWSCGGQGRNQNPRCSSGPNERPSEVVDEDLQHPHPCSPTCLPRSDFRIF